MKLAIVLLVRAAVTAEVAEEEIEDNRCNDHEREDREVLRKRVERLEGGVRCVCSRAVCRVTGAERLYDVDTDDEHDGDDDEGYDTSHEEVEALTAFVLLHHFFFLVTPFYFI